MIRSCSPRTCKARESYACAQVVHLDRTVCARYACRFHLHPTLPLPPSIPSLPPFSLSLAPSPLSTLALLFIHTTKSKRPLTSFAPQVTPLVRPSCEDGRAFIRNAVRTAREDPFPGYAPPVSRSRAKAERRRRDGAAAASIATGATEASSGAAASTTPLTGAETESAPTTGTTTGEGKAVEPAPPPRSHIDHFVMNLPESAIEFLDAFRGLYADDPRYDGDKSESLPMPMIHVHCFTREPEEGAREDIMQVRGRSVFLRWSEGAARKRALPFASPSPPPSLPSFPSPHIPPLCFSPPLNH